MTQERRQNFISDGYGHLVFEAKGFGSDPDDKSIQDIQLKEMQEDLGASLRFGNEVIAFLLDATNFSDEIHGALDTLTNYLQWAHYPGNSFGRLTTKQRKNLVKVFSRHKRDKFFKLGWKKIRDTEMDVYKSNINIDIFPLNKRLGRR